MRILIQRVRRASVSIGGTLKSAIGPGLLVFVGIEAYAFHEIRAFQAHLVAGEQAKIFFRRFNHKVVALYIQLA